MNNPIKYIIEAINGTSYSPCLVDRIKKINKVEQLKIVLLLNRIPQKGREEAIQCIVNYLRLTIC